MRKGSYGQPTFSLTHPNRICTCKFLLGTTENILKHHELMKKFPNMEHDEPNSVSLEPGGMGDVIWQFTNAGTVAIACLQPGHYEAGMKGNVTVSAN